MTPEQRELEPIARFMKMQIEKEYSNRAIEILDKYIANAINQRKMAAKLLELMKNNQSEVEVLELVAKDESFKSMLK